MKRKFWLSLACLLALCACGERVAEETPMPTPTPIPTETVSVTQTAAPSWEPSPEPTPATTLPVVVKLPEEENGRLAVSIGEGEILPDGFLLAPIENWKDLLDGNLTQYARLRAEGWIFELLATDFWNEETEENFWGGWECKLLVSRETEEGAALIQTVDILGPRGWYDTSATSRWRGALNTAGVSRRFLTRPLIRRMG